MARSIGYSLTGSVGERCFWVFYGGGANGKSTFLNVIYHLLGDYSKTTSIDTFLKKKTDDIGDGLAALKSARFVTASEPERRKRLNESLIKQITGGDSTPGTGLHDAPARFAERWVLPVCGLNQIVQDWIVEDGPPVREIGQIGGNLGVGLDPVLRNHCSGATMVRSHLEAVVGPLREAATANEQKE